MFVDQPHNFLSILKFLIIDSLNDFGMLVKNVVHKSAISAFPLYYARIRLLSHLQTLVISLRATMQKLLQSVNLYLTVIKQCCWRGLQFFFLKKLFCVKSEGGRFEVLKCYHWFKGLKKLTAQRKPCENKSRKLICFSENFNIIFLCLFDELASSSSKRERKIVFNKKSFLVNTDQIKKIYTV